VTINNVVFDIGNVLVRWDPQLIIARTFGKERASDEYVRSIFPGNDIWLPLNRGELTADQALERYRDQIGLSKKETDKLWQNILDSMDPIPGAFDLMKQLKQLGFSTYALSDNVHEIVSHLQSTHDFWPYFDGAVISAEIGLLKPDPQIFQHLLESYGLVAHETLFLDDMQHNVEGAQSVGMKAFQFSTTAHARTALRNFDVMLD